MSLVTDFQSLVTNFARTEQLLFASMRQPGPPKGCLEVMGPWNSPCISGVPSHFLVRYNFFISNHRALRRVLRLRMTVFLLPFGLLLGCLGPNSAAGDQTPADRRPDQLRVFPVHDPPLLGGPERPPKTRPFDLVSYEDLRQRPRPWRFPEVPGTRTWYHEKRGTAAPHSSPEQSGVPSIVTNVLIVLVVVGNG